MFSVESPFCEESLLELGTRAKSRELEARSLLSSPLTSGPNVVVASDKWTHVALVWNLSRKFLALHVDGQLTRMVSLEKEDKVAYVKALAEKDPGFRLVLGRGKSNGKIRNGWDGEVSAPP